MKDLKFEKPTAVEEISQEGLKGRFIIRPLDRGYGITLGNALRRVLLSSLPGAAIVNIKIDGVEHEFSTIDGVYEDVMGIILNIKKVIFRVDSDDPDFEQKLELYMVGAGKITAADFNRVDGVEIINPEQEIANLSESGRLSMEVTVRRGVGYVSAEKNKVFSRNEKSVIPVDSIYTPVTRVSYQIEKTLRDQDELAMDIETNGAIEAKEALALASKMLIDYFNVIVEISETAKEIDFIYELEEEPINKKLELTIDKLDLSVRLYNSLKRSGISTVAQVVSQTEEEVMRFRSLGRKSFKELKEKLAEHGLEFKNSSAKESRFHLADEEKE